MDTPATPTFGPRERLATLGRQALSDEELLAVLLGGGHARARARRLLDAFEGVPGLAEAVPQEVMQVSGMGLASATALCAAFELARRGAIHRPPPAPVMDDPDAVARYVRGLVGAASREHFLVLGLDVRHRVRLVHTAAVGSLGHVEVHPREVFRPLVRAGVHRAVLVHNHPSGDPTPSREDLDLTRRMAEVGRLVGIPVLDHLVVTRHDALSLAALGWMPRP